VVENGLIHRICFSDELDYRQHAVWLGRTKLMRVAIALAISMLVLSTHAFAMTLQGPANPTITYKGPSAIMDNVVWSPDGKRLASASEDGTVQVWSAP